MRLMFFSSLKKERIKKHIYTTSDLATVDIAAYIESFNNKARRHSHLGGVSPRSSSQQRTDANKVCTESW